MKALHTERLDARKSVGQKPHIGRFSTLLKWLYSLIADGNGTAYEYTSDGKLSKRTWARSIGPSRIYTSYSYDSLGQMTNISYSDSTPSISFTYDRIGRQVTVTDAQGVRTFGYDPDTLQLTNEVIVAGSVTNIITRTQDQYGRSSGLDLNGVYDVDYGFDNQGRFLGLVATNGGVEVANVTYGYLENSDLISVVSNSVNSVNSVKTYESNRNLLTSVANRHGSTLISGFAYSNDEVGRRTDRVDSGSSTATNSFGYNTRSELTSAEMGENSFSWILDNIGNRESTSRNETNRIFEANELNQYASISNGGLRELSYDFDGNLTNDAVFAHSYNGENRLIMSEPLNVTNGSKRVQSAYDYKGRRFRKVVETWDGSSWASATTNIFVYDGFNLIQEQDGTGGVIRSYVRGLDLSGTLQGAGGTGGLLAMISGSNTYFYLGDANGNVTELVNTNGDVVAHYEWDAYGNRLNEPGENEPENPFGFSSQYRDKETGFDMYIFRPFSPELERFVQRDPIEEWGGLMLYGFVKNDAVGLIDLLGLHDVPFGALPEDPGVTVTGRFSPEEQEIGNKALCFISKLRGVKQIDYIPWDVTYKATLPRSLEGLTVEFRTWHGLWFSSAHHHIFIDREVPEECGLSGMFFFGMLLAHEARHFYNFNEDIFLRNEEGERGEVTADIMEEFDIASFLSALTLPVSGRCADHACCSANLAEKYACECGINICSCK